MGLETTAQPIAFTSFRGLNTKLSDISARSREATSLQNVNLSKETVEIRGATVLFSKEQIIENGEAKPITGMVEIVLDSTVKRVVTAGSKIYSLSTSGYYTDITGALSLTDDPNALFSFAKAKDSGGNDILVACNGIDAPIKWTGTGDAAALGGTPPGNFKYILWRKNRLFGTDGEFIYHSDRLNAESWDALNWVLKISSSGIYTNEVTGIRDYGDYLAIFKEDLIKLFSGENFTDGFLIDAVTGEGAMSGYSIVEIPSRLHGNILAYVNRNSEIKGFNGTKNVINLSDPIDNTLHSYTQTRAQYACAVNNKIKNQYYVSMTRGGDTHNRIVAYDYFLDGFEQDVDPESTMLIHTNITANVLAVMNFRGSETVFSGTYDGWILRHAGHPYNQDIINASEIDADPNGAVRAANVVTITTLVDHEFEVGNNIVITDVADADFNGTFEIASVPNTNQFTYAQTGANAASGGGIAIYKEYVAGFWQSKKNSFGNAAIQKQANDFAVVTANTSSGQMKVTVITNSGIGESTLDISAQGYFYGLDSYYGEAEYGATGTEYKQAIFEMGNEVTGLNGRYFIVRFENIDGFLFSLEEYIMGITDLGFQQEYAA